MAESREGGVVAVKRESRHRESKRNREMQRAVVSLAGYLPGNRRERKILEFGSGDGYHVPYLSGLGAVTASDKYPPDTVRYSDEGVSYVTCDIRTAPFADGEFDLIFSSHVLEHIADISRAFEEIKRIGKGGCIYAFIVPTHIWMLLSLPAQAYNAVRRLCGRRNDTKRSRSRGQAGDPDSRVRTFKPRGHGWRTGFFDCVKAFRVSSWKELFENNGFFILDTVPLLLYAPSEFPVIPTTSVLTDRGLCSSVLFIMRKALPR